MGGGSYSYSNAINTRVSLDTYSKSNDEIFKERSISNEMNPKGVQLRESRDSEEHPNSLAIVLGLDVTGSMGSIPQMLVRDGLPNIMGKIIQHGEPDPQLLFLGIGDHECDRYPLQVGQFESNDELLDKWLTTTYLESGGGGNQGESYLLAWYFAALHTSIDCFEKRSRKGLLFTIGDEPPLISISPKSLQNIMGVGQYQEYTASQLLEKVQESYEVYHIHLLSTGAGRRYKSDPTWERLLGNHVVFAQDPDDVARIIVDLVTNHQQENNNNNKQQTFESPEPSKTHDIIL